MKNLRKKTGCLVMAVLLLIMRFVPAMSDCKCCSKYRRQTDHSRRKNSKQWHEDRRGRKAVWETKAYNAILLGRICLYVLRG